MKLAFCFLTRDDLHHPVVWERFFAAAPPDQVTRYCHAKFPDRVASPLLKQRLIAEQLPTRHGHFSIVAATLALFAAAYDDDAENEYFILVSESTIPIVSVAAIRAELADCRPRSLIPYWVAQPHSDHHRRLASIADRARFAGAFYCHDQWIVLHRSHVAALRDRAPLAMFARAFAVDEIYIMNVLVHLRNVATETVISRKTTWVNWAEREVRLNTDPKTGQLLSQTVHPKTYAALSPADLAAAQGCWFFRKVAAACDCAPVLPLVGAHSSPKP